MTPRGYAVVGTRRSWGRVLHGSQFVATPAFDDEAARLIANAREAEIAVLGAGLGRSYGDSGLNFGAAVIDTTELDRFLAFDADSGVVRAEAGISLSEILRFSVPHGWFLPTTPGTRFVTLAGAVANDVHGKNHHSAGTFGRSVRRIGLLRSDHGILELSREHESELFQATIGGLGLTGLILWVEVQLKRITSAYLDSETIVFSDLAGFFSLAEQSVRSFEHTVAWVDCTRSGTSLGRGLFNRGNWRADGKRVTHSECRRLSLPIELPSCALNPVSLRIFNTFYFHSRRAKPARHIQHYDAFLFPLDSVRSWNRLYGRSGFFQYQCVLPTVAAEAAVRELLTAIAASGQGSFLVVLKTFGSLASPGLMSFPFEGTTLALDFPNRGPRTLQLFARLDRIVSAARGRLYPAKDGRLPAALFRASYPNLERFINYVDPAFSSNFWRRMCNG